jgi:uracil-DNA glycosylase family 4
MNGHICEKIDLFPLDKFHQLGKGKGKNLLIVGESPAPSGWIISGKACYRPDGKILPTGKRLNELLNPLDLSVEICGFTELAKCFVAERTELSSCSKKCWPIFLKQIKRKDYKLLIILGVKTTSIFSKLTEKELVVGKITNLKLSGDDYKILPIFHPSPINPTGHKKNTALFKKLYPTLEKILK